MNPPQGFSGFPEGKVRLTPIPAQLFNELLPDIDNLGELKLTLYMFWALDRKGGTFPYMSRTEMAGDDLLMKGLSAPGVPAEETLDDALERAVARGSLLRVAVEFEEGEEGYYFLNSPRGRAAVEGLRQGTWAPEDAPSPIRLREERPNAFTLYEQNIGPLTPLIADVLREAEATFPQKWIEEAIQIAVKNNVRKWTYVHAILDDWQARGRYDREDRGDSKKARRRYLESYRKYLEG